MSKLQNPAMLARVMNPDYLTTPAEITDRIKSACAEVSRGQEPVYLPLIQIDGMKVQDCHNNVPKQIEAGGGEIVCGWTIWEAPEFLLEFEFHSVWRSPDGELMDVTPKPDGEQRILFLPDPNKTFDFSGEFLHTNRSFPLSDDPEVVEIAGINQRFAEKKLRVETEIRLGKRPPSDYGDVFRELLEEVIPDKLPKPVLAEMPEGYQLRVGRNDPCPCGSGKKFKMCCIPR